MEERAGGSVEAGSGPLGATAVYGANNEPVIIGGAELDDAGIFIAAFGC